MTTQKAHCLILPYPAQGHINPMLQFSKRLQSKGVKITIAATKSFLKTMQELSTSVSVEAISDGYDDGGREQAGTFVAYITRFKEVGSDTLSQLIGKLTNCGCPVSCIVYDPFLPWAVEVGNNFGVATAAFFTQSCAVDNIYYHVHKGVLKLPPTDVDKEISIPGLLTIEASDVPSFVSNPESSRILEMLVNQFSNLENTDWVLINSFYELEKEVIDWMAKIYPIKTIGPTIPSMYLDKRLPDDKEYGLSVFKPMTNACLNWLNHQPVSSVVYVSFGSLAKLEAEQMEELAWGLSNSNKNFLWVVRSTEESKLPNNFLEELASEKGLVVSWCPQLQVLEHKSIGCFLTHCGWNSTLEAISLGVPMIAMPHWSDQPTNAKLVEDVWEMGIRPKQDEKGLVRREVIEECIKIVMEEKKGKKIRENAKKWKELARKAVDEGGSSDRNIEEFVSKLVTIASVES
ncbi:UDP-glycosyltransferase 74G1-like [Nicotiana tabacum]|uniref:Glycosyltransferase n=1 Tax=Nicotiana tabacum TaxID=4097 RepID=Q9M6E7_TOBAC|nr:UDP-glycosyltransferase 74G1-like [Nicotiana tabacum]XP_009630995.1 UDP-glycosyltransferase 74G1-like [Nicotiana tomentosiformis]AAF61647.1 UDP-glucose:salicylic acid glucosyltransferase [Nicotiana tabacum]WIW42864.1 UDP-glycosyltransferase [Nicotiana tabacum]